MVFAVGAPCWPRSGATVAVLLPFGFSCTILLPLLLLKALFGGLLLLVLVPVLAIGLFAGFVALVATLIVPVLPLLFIVLVVWVILRSKPTSTAIAR